MTTRKQDDSMPLPPGVWEALAKEILNDGKDSRPNPQFMPMAQMTPMRSDNQGLPVVQRDLPHFLREDETKGGRSQAGERSGFGAVAVILCLIGATAAGLGGYLISSGMSQSNGALAWLERIVRGGGTGTEARPPAQSERPATPSRVESSFAEAASQEAVREAAASSTQRIAVTATTLAPAVVGEASQANARPAAAEQPREVASIDPARSAPSTRPALPGAAPSLPPPPAAPALVEPAPKGPTAESGRLIQRARKLIEDTGDITSARLLLTRALDIGDAQAAFLLAETYDAQALARWGVIGLKGDSAIARRYYQQALAGGVADARGRIAALGN